MILNQHIRRCLNVESIETEEKGCAGPVFFFFFSSLSLSLPSLLLLNVCPLLRGKRGVSAKKRKERTKEKTKESNSQQGHRMSAFNIDSIFSSSVRYPERYVLEPETIVCRLRQTRGRGGTAILPSSSCCLLTDRRVPFVSVIIIIIIVVVTLCVKIQHHHFKR